MKRYHFKKDFGNRHFIFKLKTKENKKLKKLRKSTFKH